MKDIKKSHHKSNQNLFCHNCSHHDQFGLDFCMWRILPSAKHFLCTEKRQSHLFNTLQTVVQMCTNPWEKRTMEIWNPPASCFSGTQHSEMKHSGRIKISRIILNIGTNSTENIENQMIKIGYVLIFYILRKEKEHCLQNHSYDGATVWCLLKPHEQNRIRKRKVERQSREFQHWGSQHTQYRIKPTKSASTGPQHSTVLVSQVENWVIRIFPEGFWL